MSDMKSVAPFALAAIGAFLLYTKRYSYALYVGLFLAAWLGYDLYEKKSVTNGAEGGEG
jgi:hypothetical protein